MIRVLFYIGCLVIFVGSADCCNLDTPVKKSHEDTKSVIDFMNETRVNREFELRRENDSLRQVIEQSATQ